MAACASARRDRWKREIKPIITSVLTLKERHGSITLDFTLMLLLVQMVVAIVSFLFVTPRRMEVCCAHMG